MADGAQQGSKICGACAAPVLGANHHSCMSCDKPVHSWAMADNMQCGVWMPEEGNYHGRCSLIGERERSRRCSCGPAVRGEVEPAKGFHPWQGAIQTGRLARRLVDLPPVEKLRLAARQDLRDRHERHSEAVQKVQLPRSVGRQLKGARLAQGGQLCTWRRCCP